MDPLLGDGIRVLHVDDEAGMRETAATVLERDSPSLSVETATSASDALDRLADSPPVDCIVSDYQMPGRNGLELLAAVREREPDLPFILFTGKGSEEIASEAISAGVTDYIQKERGVEQFAVLAKRIENAVAERRARDALERTTHRFQTLVSESSDVIMVAEPDGILRYVSGATERVLDVSADELIGESLFDLVHADDRDCARTTFENVRDTSVDTSTDASTVVLRTVRGDGTCIRLEAEGRNLLDDDVIEGIVIYARDVTERVERERNLERYERIVETGGDAAQVIDTDGQYVMVNDKLVERTGYDRDELLGSTPRTVMDDADYEKATSHLGDVLDDEDRDYAEFEVTIRPKERDPYPVEARVAPILEDGQFRGSVGTSREIADRKRRERELERQNERLSQFAGVVSHDLRNPLNVAQARTELALAETEDDHLDVVDDALDRMEGLIEDLLTLTREGRAVEDTEPFDLQQVAREAWASVATGEATLVVGDAVTLEGDRCRVKQALENLFRNAVEHGGPDVRVTVDELPGGGFYVADDGVGLDGTDPESLFEPDYSTNDEGTGLGLAIVRDIVAAHGWEIHATEADSGGARFDVVESPAEELVDD